MNTSKPQTLKPRRVLFFVIGAVGFVVFLGFVWALTNAIAAKRANRVERLVAVPKASTDTFCEVVTSQLVLKRVAADPTVVPLLKDYSSATDFLKKRILAKPVGKNQIMLRFTGDDPESSQAIMDSFMCELEELLTEKH